MRKSSQKDGGVERAERTRKQSQVDPGGSQTGRKQSEVDADFQFSMLKASLDYDTEVNCTALLEVTKMLMQQFVQIFGSGTAQNVVENNPLSRNISTIADQNGSENFKRKSKKSNNQNCNAPGAMNAYSQYAQV